MDTTNISQSTTISRSQITAFQKKIWNFYKTQKRDFPWRETKDPYYILVSEIMLQQTQTSRVIEKYNRFISELPTIQDLAQVSIPKLLSLWHGLGYNRRALYLQRSAQQICSQTNGVVSKDPKELVKLPGIGPNTAASIIVFSYNLPLVFIETNIRRVFIHEFYNDVILNSFQDPTKIPKQVRNDKDETLVSDKQILPLVEQTLDQKNPREWYYALMDYGSHLPKLVVNPNRKSKHYTKQSKFEGSLRQVRGKILKELIRSKKISRTHLEEKVTTNQEFFIRAIEQLIKEGFIETKNNNICLKN